MARLTNTRARRDEVIVNRPVDNVALGSLATNTTYTVDLAPGLYNVALSAWTAGNSDGKVDIKVKPFTDSPQAIAGRVLSGHEIGSSTVATVVSVASNNTGAGVVAQYVNDAGATGNVAGTAERMAVPHGLQILVDTNTNATTSASLGNLTIEVYAENP